LSLPPPLKSIVLSNSSRFSIMVVVYLHRKSRPARDIGMYRMIRIKTL
jgi:hypothetical protein